MGFAESLRTCFGKYAKFDGRASKSEFWYFCLAAVLVQVIIGIIEIATGMVDIDSTEMGTGGVGGGPLSIIFTLLILVPSISVTSRRLQDRGLSGWWQLLYLTIIGIPVIVVLNMLPAKEDENNWGRNPLL